MAPISGTLLVRWPMCVFPSSHSGIRFQSTPGAKEYRNDAVDRGTEHWAESLDLDMATPEQRRAAVDAILSFLPHPPRVAVLLHRFHFPGFDSHGSTAAAPNVSFNGAIAGAK